MSLLSGLGGYAACSTPWGRVGHGLSEDPWFFSRLVSGEFQADFRKIMKAFAGQISVPGERLWTPLDIVGVALAGHMARRLVPEHLHEHARRAIEENHLLTRQ